MTNKEMLCTALKQSALELNCTVDDLTGGKSKAVISSTAEGARKYLSLPFYCQLVSYGSGIVASVNEEIYADAKAYIEKYAPEHCFETPNMLVLQSALERRGMSACFMAEYWLCDTDAIRMIDCGYERGCSRRRILRRCIRRNGATHCAKSERSLMCWV